MKLSENVFKNLITQISITDVASDIEVLERSTVPTHFKNVQSNKANTYVNGKLTHLSTSNINLNHILESISQRKTEDIIALHLMESNKGAYAAEHTDTGSNLTLVILLDDAFTGGYVYIMGNKYNGMRERGEYMLYCGNEVKHGVSEVESGTRKVLVVWYKKPKNLL